MLPFPTLILIDKKAETAIYQQIANQLVKLIRDGIIHPGARLPGSRLAPMDLFFRACKELSTERNYKNLLRQAALPAPYPCGRP